METRTPPIEGLWLPLVTPFRDGRPDEASLVRLFRHYAGEPVDGLILAATTGEGQRFFFTSFGFDLAVRGFEDLETNLVAVDDTYVTDEVIRTKQSVSQLQYIKNTNKTVLCTGIPVLDETGQLSLVVINERDITLLEVVEAAEGPIALEQCVLQGGPCEWEDSCPVHIPWARAQNALAAQLDATTFADLAGHAAEIDAGTHRLPADAPPHEVSAPRRLWAEGEKKG